MHECPKYCPVNSIFFCICFALRYCNLLCIMIKILQKEKQMYFIYEITKMYVFSVHCFQFNSQGLEEQIKEGIDKTWKDRAGQFDARQKGKTYTTVTLN